jgi:hypothetical protein
MITVETAKVYRGGGRRYLTMRSAIHAEAKKLIEAKHPTERTAYGRNGEIVEPGWYWREKLNRSDVLFRRVCRLVKSAGTPVHGESRVSAPGAVEGGR